MFRSRMLMAGALLTLTALVSTIGAPAFAQPVPGATSGMTADFNAAVTSGAVVILPPENVEASDGKKGGKWKGGAIKNTDTGKWMATATDRDGGSMAWGSYDTKEEAQAEGDKQAAYNNSHGVVAGPGCTPPLVLC